jgi:hypothetical protein
MGSFRAAAASPWGKGIMHKGLSFSSLSQESAALLAGTIPPQWYGSDNILREFLTSFAIPSIVKKHPPILIDITEDDVTYSLKKWKNPLQLLPPGDIWEIIKPSSKQVTVQSGLALRRWCNAVNILDVFIDDTLLGFTNHGLVTLETMIAKLNNIAQTWQNIQFYSGGTLNLSKCSWYIMSWQWKTKPTTK